MASSGCEAERGAIMTPRSLLFVPGDSERKLERALGAGADALILDLEDSVAVPRKRAARDLVTEYLNGGAGRASGPSLWVRINPPSTPLGVQDLASVVAARPDGLVVPKPRGPSEVAALAGELTRIERRHGLSAGATRLLPIATETPQSLFAMGGYVEVGSRLAALTWGAEDLSVALGASTAVDADGEWLFTYQLARALCLAAAAAGGVAAIDTVYTDFRDARGLQRRARDARRDGFAGKLAIHPEQIGIINEAFLPSSEEIAAARRVVAAFDAAESETGDDAGEIGVAALDGKMLDRPHLIRARRLLALAAKRWNGP